MTLKQLEEKKRWQGFQYCVILELLQRQRFGLREITDEEHTEFMKDALEFMRPLAKEAIELDKQIEELKNKKKNKL